MSKNSFIIYVDSLGLLEHVSYEQGGRLIYAIKKYQDGEEPEMDPTTAALFAQFRAQFERDEKKYEEIRRKRAESGKQGGVAKGSNSKQVLASASESEQKPPDSDSGSGSDSVSDSEKGPPTNSSQEKSASKSSSNKKGSQSIMFDKEVQEKLSKDVGLPVSFVSESAKDASDWLKSKGANRKDYIAFLRMWLKRSDAYKQKGQQQTPFKKHRSFN